MGSRVSACPSNKPLAVSKFNQSGKSIDPYDKMSFKSTSEASSL